MKKRKARPLRFVYQLPRDALPILEGPCLLSFRESDHLRVGFHPIASGLLNRRIPSFLDVASVESPFVGWYLNQEFQKKVQDLDNPRRLKIGPLVVLSAEELEDIEANRDPLGIFEMLKRKGAEDPLHTDSFHIFANQHLWAKSARNERIAAQFDGLFDEVVTLLFGKQGAAARRRDDHRRDHPVA